MALTRLSGENKAVSFFFKRLIVSEQCFGYIVLILGAIALIISARLSSSEPKAA
jgi:hypothetical protein